MADYLPFGSRCGTNNYLLEGGKIKKLLGLFHPYTPIKGTDFRGELERSANRKTIE